MNAMRSSLLFTCAAVLAAVSNASPDKNSLRRVSGMRSDGVDVFLPPTASIRGELAPHLGDFPFQPFSPSYIKAALAQSVDWRTKGIVTPAKDQGATGTCGTFGRVAAAEGQFARRVGPLTNFSEEELYDCIGWDLDQFSYFSPKGFMTSEDYPFNSSAVPGGDRDPPVPGRPCKYDAAKVVPKSGGGTFTNITGAAPSEDQLVAFVLHNGPTQTGIYSDVFALREKGCEATGSCWITEAMCASVAGKDIDHSITLVGYGVDEARGPYWIAKNSWSTAFGNNGFINIFRGANCGQISCCGNLFTVGDPAAYYE